MTNGSRWAAILVTLATISGCETTTATEEDYGNSVRQMVRNQTLNPSPADSAPVDAGDGVRAENTIDVYRKDVSHPEEVNKDLVIGVSGNGSR